MPLTAPTRPTAATGQPLRLLAFDTSTEVMSVAVSGPSGVFTREGGGGAQASARLIPDIMALLEEAGCSLKQLDAIAFGRGPGAFTGLRTACSVAQGLAFGAGKPVLPIDSLLAVAQDALMHSGDAGDADDAAEGPQASASVWVVMDARMNEIYAAHYTRCAREGPSQGGQWHATVAPMLTTAADLVVRWQAQPPQWVAGSALRPFGEALMSFNVVNAAPDADGSPATLPIRWVPDALPRALAMLQLAEQLWREGGAVDAALALPVYVRDKVAQTTAERDVLRAAKEAAIGMAAS